MLKEAPVTEFLLFLLIYSFSNDRFTFKNLCHGFFLFFCGFFKAAHFLSRQWTAVFVTAISINQFNFHEYHALENFQNERTKKICSLQIILD